MSEARCRWMSVEHFEISTPSTTWHIHINACFDLFSSAFRRKTTVGENDPGCYAVGLRCWVKLSLNGIAVSQYRGIAESRYRGVAISRNRGITESWVCFVVPWLRVK